MNAPMQENLVSQAAARNAGLEDPSFYRKTVQGLLPFCGYEYVKVPNINLALQFLNKELKLNIPQDQINSLDLLYHKLYETNRFRGTLYMPEELGENSTIHSFQTSILINEVFRRSGVLQSSNEILIDRIRITASLCALVHDLGEIFGEFSTLEERNRDLKLQEDPEIEQQIFVNLSKLAIRDTFLGNPQEFNRSFTNLKKEFFIKLRESSDKAKEFLQQAGGFVLKDVNVRAEFFWQDLVKAFALCEIKDEGQDNRDLFLGYFVKACEHIQGVRHFNRFARKDDQSLMVHKFREDVSENEYESLEKSEKLYLTTSQDDSYGFLSGIKYLESEVGHCLKYAIESGDKDLIALARAVQKAVYQTAIERISIGPKYIDRFATEKDADILNLEKQFKADRSQENYNVLVSAIEKESLRLEACYNRQQAANGGEVSTNSRYMSREILSHTYELALILGYTPKAKEVLACNPLLSFATS